MTTDYRLLLVYPNRLTAASALSGGAWSDAMPLENISDRQFSRAARSLNLDLMSTWFDVDLGRQRGIRGIAFLAHNFSFSARIRARGSNVPDFATTVVDQTFDAWPAAGGDWNIDELEWENDNYWLGSYSPEDVEGQTAASPIIFATPRQARYWRFNIIDLQNADGFIDIGRLFIGDGFLQPRINYSWGAQEGYRTDTSMQKSLGGSKYFDRRESLRVIRFDLNHLDRDEARQALELMRRAGTDGEIFVIPDPSDQTYGPQRNFLGHLVQPGLLTQAAFGQNSIPVEIEELR
jgi:hypothetical protein